MKYKNVLKPVDRPFLIALLMLIGIGILMVFSASMYSSSVNGEPGYSQFIRQSSFAAIGLLIMYALSRFNYKFFEQEKVAYLVLIVSVLLLAAVLVPGIGRTVNDARRWIYLGPIGFQPSEIAKISGIIYLSAIVSKNPEMLREPVFRKETWELWGKCVFPIFLLCGLTIIEPSMSAAVAIGLGMISVLWFAGISKKQFLLILVPVFVGGFLMLFVGWRWRRILALFGQSTVNYQITQSLLGFGSGGIFGVGLGNGKQKLLFLPEIQNDFIFANIGEEFGLIGCIFVLALYAFLIQRGFRIGIACKDKFGMLYTLSTMTLLGFQVCVNVAVAINLYPVTGMALPFISYGGTSLIILLATVGPILNVSRHVNLESHRSERKSYEDTNGSRRNRRAYLPRNSHFRRTQKSYSRR